MKSKLLAVSFLMVAVLLAMAVAVPAEGAAVVVDSTREEPWCKPGCWHRQSSYSVPPSIKAITAECTRIGAGRGLPDPCGGTKDVYSFIVRHGDVITEDLFIGCGGCNFP
jgi:hypothetical protein